MTHDIKSVEYWQEKHNESEQKIAELTKRIEWYEEQFRLAKHRQFGRSSEQTTSEIEQMGLFNEIEAEADLKLPEPTIEQVTFKPKKRKGKKEEDLSNLPVEVYEYVLLEDEQICSDCGCALHKMSKQIRKELIIIPAQVKVREHEQNIYSCRNCEKNSDQVPIIKAMAYDPLIKGSLASPSAVAHIAVQKYINAVPLYRQEQDLIRNGVTLSRQTMANWLIRCSEDWLEPIYETMKKKLLQEEVLHADETVVQVLREPVKKATTNSYMWLYRTSGYTKHPIVLYEYQPTRSSSHPKQFLDNFKGFLHTDGYAGYHKLPNITVVGCWAHARRKFDEALKAIPKEEQPDSASKKGLEFCTQLFQLEQEYQKEKLTPENRQKERLKRSKPVAEAFLAWAKSVNPLPKSALGKAIYYWQEQWPYLSNVFLDGRLELSNNRAERSIKPFVIGRKNWLFSNSQKGARASSIIYSIFETAKENRIKPFDYLEFLLTDLPHTPIKDIDLLLPWSDNLPQSCYISKPISG